MYKKRIILKPIAIVFKAASSHVKRLVGERGEWEVEVERLRFFFWIFFNFSFFWIKTEVLLSSTREQHKARSRELRDQCKSLCSMRLITYYSPLLISPLVIIIREHRPLLRLFHSVLNWIHSSDYLIILYGFTCSKLRYFLFQSNKLKKYSAGVVIKKFLTTSPR